MNGINNIKMSESEICLSDEQNMFISKALQGNNILVDACIGSGKTTAIQHLCNVLPKNYKVLYLTYNRLLKLDAKTKIKAKNVTVTNYHGFAYMVLRRINISAGMDDLVQRFNQEKPILDHYDLLIIDEYQDIEEEFAVMLKYIKSSNPNMQIIAVGDMEQKIYDKTILNVPEFIDEFLGEHIKLEFTQCFRLSSALAEKLGRIWKKKINGVNDNCIVKKMNQHEVIDFLSKQLPSDILCLGARGYDLADTLNILESNYPDTFNKRTVYASIRDKESGGNTEPDSSSAIFTTFDSSKGLERKICVIFDFTENYWDTRINKSNQSYEILRNIFCVAASRGKDMIIFVNNGEKILSEKTLSTQAETNVRFEDVDISSMFDFKYKEDIEECYKLLKIKQLQKQNDSVIDIKNTDGKIDLSPCIGMYQEAVFFNNNSVDTAIDFYLRFNKKKEFLYTEQVKTSSLDKKILFLTTLETNQNRYIAQVDTPFVHDYEKEKIIERLSSCFTRDEIVQVKCSIDFGGEVKFSAIGLADVVKNGVVYELKFVSELSHEHFLQCACYVVALGLEKGILWNTRDNTAYEISVPNVDRFKDAVLKTITKGYYPKKNSMNNIAIIDTETTWNDRVMSIGAVIADAETFNPVASKYYILNPECLMGGMYSRALELKDGGETMRCTRDEAIRDIYEFLETFGVNSIFAYNASFDRRHLPELSEFAWYDIMRLAAYKQHNSKIPQDADCFNTGKLRRNYGVESMMRLLSEDNRYFETHNALHDALDELKIMQLLGHGLEKYDCAILKERESYKSDKAISSSNIDMTDIAKNKNPVPTNIEQKSILREENKPTTATNHVSPTHSTDEEYCTVSDAMEILGVSRNTVYSLINSGEIPAAKRNNRYSILRKDIENYIERKQKERIERLERIAKYQEEYQSKTNSMYAVMTICVVVAAIIFFALICSIIL